jgi:hypothetical protein
VQIVDAVVDDLADAPDFADTGDAVVGPGDVERVGTFAHDQDRTMFVEELDYRRRFDDHDLSDNNGTLVLPADICPPADN